MSITGKVDIGFTWKSIDTGDEQAFTNTEDGGRSKNAMSFSSGQGNNQAQKVYRGRHRLTSATGTLDLDLTDGTLLDPFGNALVFTKIKYVHIVNRGKDSGDNATFTTTDGEDVLVGGAGSGNHAWGAPFNGDQDAKVVVDSGDSLAFTKRLTGYTVSAGSSDVLRIDHNGTDDLTVDVVIIGY